MDKANMVINKALEKYKPAAAEKVREALCSTCPDKRCETGAPCNTYALLVRVNTWAMIPAKNN